MMHEVLQVSTALPSHRIGAVAAPMGLSPRFAHHAPLFFADLGRLELVTHTAGPFFFHACSGAGGPGSSVRGTTRNVSEELPRKQSN
jgi:hypothetical protein